MEIVVQTVIPAVGAATLYSGSTTFDIDANKTLKIETSPDGEDILDSTVPVGKKWKVSIKVSITETDI